MFGTIVTSKTRLKLLIKFFLFDGIQGYMRSMEREFNESTNSIRVELNRLTDAGLLTSTYKGRLRIYKANPNHPLYPDLKSIVRKTVGLDMVYRIIGDVDNLEAAYITGSLACGVDSDTVELVLVGKELNKSDIDVMVQKTEKLMSRKIMCLTFTRKQMDYFFKGKPVALLWEKEGRRKTTGEKPVLFEQK